MASNKIKTGYTVKCANDECCKEVYVKKGTYEKSEYKLFTCSRECQNTENVVKRRLDRFEEIHGVRNKGWTEESQKKIKKTNLEKFGCENPFQNEEIKEKIKKTNLEKYGVTSPMKSKEIQEKALKTRIDKYGEENLMGCVPRDRYEEACLKKYGVPHFFQSEEGKQDLQSVINRYGEEEGNRLYKEYGSKKAITLENMINKYGEEEGCFRYDNWKESCKHTLETFIDRHGEKGKEMYSEYLKKKSIASASRKSRSVSNVSLELFDGIVSDLKLENALYGENEYVMESFMGDERNFYKLDFLYEKKVIEFMGDFWHANPKKYSPDEFLNFYGNLVLVEDIWIRDDMKRKHIKNSGYELMEVWEEEYRSNKEDVSEKCKGFLRS
jgi:hypothetical protein